MKATITDTNGKKSGTMNLPPQFSELVRHDLIKKANEVVEANSRTPYGAFLKAGQRASAVLSRRRKNFRSPYGRGVSRVPRKAMWRRGTQFGWTGAFAPGTVSGRKAHPPKATKDLKKKMNVYERRKAIRSALAATVIPEVVRERGHKFKELIPIIDTKAEALQKTKEVESLFIKLQLADEITRTNKKKVRAGKGKLRGRKYKTKKGPLFVVSKACPLEKAAANILGVEVCQVNNLNVALLAPGGNPGRLTIFSEDAMKRLEKEKLFMAMKNKRVIKKPKKTKEKVVKKKVVKKMVKKAVKKTVKQTKAKSKQ